MIDLKTLNKLNSLLGDVGDASGSTLGSLYAILGNPAYTFYAMLTSVAGAVNDAAAAVTDFDTNLTEATNDHYNGCLLMFTSGANLGQCHVIDDYVGASKNVSFIAGDRWTDAPSNGDTFIILPCPGALLKKIWLGIAGLTSFKQESATATNVNGTTWGDLEDHSTITKVTKICGLKVTKGGTWAGSAKIRITDGSSNKIWPFQDEYVEGTDFIDATEIVFNQPVVVDIASGYKVQFRSSAAADGAGETLTLDFLDVIELG